MIRRRASRFVGTIGLNCSANWRFTWRPCCRGWLQQTGELFGEPITSWEQSQQPLLGTPVGKFPHMMQRVDPKQVEAMVAASAEPESAD